MTQPGRPAGGYFMTGLLIIAAVLVIDQYTKWLVMEGILRANGPAHAGFIDWFITPKKLEFFVTEREKFNSIALLPFLNLVMVWNQGISFGLLGTDSPHMPLILIGTSTMISLMMVVWLTLTAQRLTAIALGLIVGGAVGNVIDRVRFNAVADFIDVYVGAYHWPAFNVADSCIFVGACLLMLKTFLSKEESPKK